MAGNLIMHRASSRFMPRIALACIPLLMLSPVVAGHADDSAVAAPATAEPTAMTITIKNCNDSGPGSLRAAVARALSGDSIDMRGLGCRRINLTSGAIMIPQGFLNLIGGGITVDANRMSSVFRHTGGGTLTIRGMTIARGVYRHATQPLGGCIYSAGSIRLENSRVHWCSVDGTTPRVMGRGGGIYAASWVTLIGSEVLGNVADIGGGLYGNSSYGSSLLVNNSRVCGNTAYSRAGGAYSYNSMYSQDSTFSHNKGGALEAGSGSFIRDSTFSDNKGGTATVSLSGPHGHGEPEPWIIQSTFSGNTPKDKTLAIPTDRLHPTDVARILNNTIAFNRHGRCDFATVWVEKPTRIDSTIVANNSCAGDPYPDIGGPDSKEAEVVGDNNLIMSSTLPLPPDTISLYPRLAPLADNGGPTRTHALLDDSPAIDMGNSAYGYRFDQRGPGFPRVKGPQADIGAYER